VGVQGEEEFIDDILLGGGGAAKDLDGRKNVPHTKGRDRP